MRAGGYARLRARVAILGSDGLRLVRDQRNGKLGPVLVDLPAYFFFFCIYEGLESARMQGGTDMISRADI